MGRMTESARGAAQRGRTYAVTGAERVNEMRPRVPALDAAMSARERDVSRGGSILAGALAFRLFVPLLPFALLMVVALGYATEENSGAPASVSSSLGLSKSAMSTIAHSARLSHGAQLSVVLFALFALFTSSMSAVRTLRLVHALAWGLPLKRFPRAAAASMAFIGGMTLMIAMVALSSWARAKLGAAGIPVTVAVTIGFGAVWLVASQMLPHPAGLAWHAFLPGSLLVAVGIEGIHLATVFYIAQKAETASATYGTLGISLVLLFWLYLLGRLIVAAAVLNATLSERRTGDAEPLPAADVGEALDALRAGPP